MQRPMILIPGWHQTSSGIWVHASINPPMRSGGAAGYLPPLPKDLLPTPQPVVIMKQAPSFLDQIAVFADEEAAGLPVSSLETVRARARTLPFEGAMSLVAEIAAKSFGLLGDQQRQLAFAELVFNDPALLERLRTFIRRGTEQQIFAEQHALILERILIEEADDGVLELGVSPFGRAVVARNLLGCTAISSASLERMRSEDRTSEETMAVLLQNGSYNSKEMLMGEMTRAVELYGRIAQHPELLPSHDKVYPLDEWMIKDYGFSIEEQLRIGFSFGAMTHGLSDGPDSGKAHLLTPDNIEDLILKLGLHERRKDFFDLISADREQLRREFAYEGDDLDHVAWERRPLMRRPFLRCQNGELILFSPRSIQQWVGEGFFYRLLTSAQNRCSDDPKRKLSRNFIAYTGQLLEVYALDLMHSAYPDENNPISGVRVFGEQPYGPSGHKKTSDVAVLIGGADLILFEISGARMKADTLISGAAADAIGDVKRMIIEKVDQLDGCISALRSDDPKAKAHIPAEKPEVDMDQVKRIFPVVVTAGGITQTIPLWQHIEAKTRKMLQQPGAQPLTLFSIQDYEVLCYLIELGVSLNEILTRKTHSQFAQRELAIWLRDDPWAPKNISGRPQHVETVWKKTFARIMSAIDFNKGWQPPPGTAAQAA
jgi:hypothetical protein